MGRQRSAAERELYQRCDEVLHYVWDPIRVAGEPGARDEYAGYLPQVFRRVLDGQGIDQIADDLVRIETELMGLRPNRDRAENAATTLLKWRDWIEGRAS